MNKKQIEMMACPQCHKSMSYDKSNQELICDNCKLAFPVQDGIPVMLIEEARKIESVE